MRQEASDDSSDEDLPDIDIGGTPGEINLATNLRHDNIFTGTDDRSCNDHPKSKTWESVTEEITEDDFQTGSSASSQEENIELINLCGESSEEFRLSGENILMSDARHQFADIPVQLNIRDEDIPDLVYWSSVLSGFRSCHDFHQVVGLVLELKAKGIRQLSKRVEAFFIQGIDNIDHVAQSEIPIDGPIMLKAVWTEGDGNCLCRALSKAFFNDDSMHLEIHARIVIEGVLNMDKYLTDDCLERGASYIHKNAELPCVFATFSEYYTPRQKMTEDMINYIYSMEIYSSSHENSYMGIWQLAQAASVLGIPIHTIYPVRGQCTIRNDFHRIFFPVDYPTTSDDNPVVIMWTGVKRGTAPVHFIPLLTDSLV